LSAKSEARGRLKRKEKEQESKSVEKKSGGIGKKGIYERKNKNRKKQGYKTRNCRSLADSGCYATVKGDVKKRGLKPQALFCKKQLPFSR